MTMFERLLRRLASLLHAVQGAPRPNRSGRKALKALKAQNQQVEFTAQDIAAIQRKNQATPKTSLFARLAKRFQTLFSSATTPARKRNRGVILAMQRHEQGEDMLSAAVQPAAQQLTINRNILSWRMAVRALGTGGVIGGLLLTATHCAAPELPNQLQQAQTRAPTVLSITPLQIVGDEAPPVINITPSGVKTKKGPIVKIKAGKKKQQIASTKKIRRAYRAMAAQEVCAMPFTMDGIFALAAAPVAATPETKASVAPSKAKGAPPKKKAAPALKIKPVPKDKIVALFLEADGKLRNGLENELNNKSARDVYLKAFDLACKNGMEDSAIAKRAMGGLALLYSGVPGVTGNAKLAQNMLEKADPTTAYAQMAAAKLAIEHPEIEIKTMPEAPTRIKATIGGSEKRVRVTFDAPMMRLSKQ